MERACGYTLYITITQAAIRVQSGRTEKEISQTPEIFGAVHRAGWTTKGNLCQSRLLHTTRTHHATNINMEYAGWNMEDKVR